MKLLFFFFIMKVKLFIIENVGNAELYMEENLKPFIVPQYRNNPY